MALVFLLWWHFCGSVLAVSHVEVNQFCQEMEGFPLNYCSWSQENFALHLFVQIGKVQVGCSLATLGTSMVRPLVLCISVFMHKTGYSESYSYFEIAVELEFASMWTIYSMNHLKKYGNFEATCMLIKPVKSPPI